MRFHQPDAFRSHSGAVVGVQQGFFLAGGAGGVDGISLAVAGGTDAADYRINLISVALGIGQAFENDYSQPLAQNRAVSGRIERFGVAGRGEGRSLAETHVHENVVESVDAAGDDDVGLAGGQFHAGQVQGAERAGAGGIHDAVGPAQVELLADPSGDHIAEQAGEGVLLPWDIGFGDALNHIFADIFVNTGILERFAPDRVTQSRSQRDDQFQRAGHAQYDAGLAPVIFPFRPVTGILQCLSGRHQSQQLGGVDRLKHIWRDVELHRVEVNRGDEAAPLAVGAVGALLVLIVVIGHLPVGIGDI